MNTHPSSSVAGARRRRWLPYGLVLAAPVLAGIASALLFHPAGTHAAGHLTSGVIAGAQFAVLVVSAWLLRRSMGRLPLLVLPVILVGLAMEVMGNFSVARSIWDKNWDDDQAGDLGSAIAGFEQGHTLAESGDVLVVVGGLAFAIAALLSHRYGRKAPVLAMVLAVFPPWIMPAIGTTLLLAHLAVITDQNDS